MEHQVQDAELLIKFLGEREMDVIGNQLGTRLELDVLELIENGPFETFTIKTVNMFRQMIRDGPDQTGREHVLERLHRTPFQQTHRTRMDRTPRSVIVPLMIFGLGAGLGMCALTDTVMAAVPAEDAGVGVTKVVAESLPGDAAAFLVEASNMAFVDAMTAGLP